jgi:cold shock CspA family protein
MAAGFAFVAEEESGEECFLHVREFRKAVISWSGLFVVGTFLEFTKEPATPRPRAVKVKVLS